MARSPDRETASLMDRIALAFLGGLSALVLAALAWGGVAILAAQLGFEGLPPLWPVGVFTSVMAMLGFIALENFVGNLIGSMIRAVLHWLHWLVP